MKIAIMSTMPPNTYSGGRYDAWAMAEGLAAKGNTVYFITNHQPIFYDDFKEYEAHLAIRLIITADFDVEIEENELDYVVLIPNQDKTNYFYAMCRNFAKRKKAKLILRNFESPNWFNKYAPVPRDEKMWDFWKDTCNDGCLVLSISQEAMKYSKEYYVDNLKYTRFDYWYPAMNSKAADKFNVEKEKRIVSFVRFTDKHKGGGDIFDVLGDFLKGYTMVFVVGNGQVTPMYERKLEFLSDKYGFQYEIKLRLSDEEKFKEIKRARFMLFPSYFEGYGYPPVEAQYCNTLCIAYDLPVLRETSGDGIIYCERGNIYAMREALQEAIENYEYKDLKHNVLELGDFGIRADRIQETLEKYLTDDYRNPKAPYLKVDRPKQKVQPVKKKEEKAPPKEERKEQKKEQKSFNRWKDALAETLSEAFDKAAHKCKRAAHLMKEKIKYLRNSIFLRKIPVHLGKNTYHKETGVLYMKGWYLTWREIDRVEIENSSGKSLGYAVFGQSRKDIYEKYPKYGTRALGWEFEGTVGADDLDEFIRVKIMCSDGKIVCADFVIEEENML